MKKLGESCREAWGKLPGSLKKIKAELEKTWRKLEKPSRKITGSFGKLENGQRENCGKGKRMANQLETVLKKTQAVYKQAAEELAKKLADFQSKFAAKDKEKRALLAAGEITKQDYKNWLAGQVFQGKQWEAKAKEAAETMVHADTEAAAIVNDGCMTAYAAAMNYGTYELEKTTGLSTGFTLYNRETVSRLLAKDPQLLPYWKIDQPKDYVWNYEKVKSTILQGIIQGKPIPEITKDLASKLQTNNTNRMRLFARTEMTGAHNAGRIDALHRAADLGIKVQKKWLATNDNRTRDAHADLDGQIREVDEPFDSELGEIMYPGDPSADPANVYNCRCTLVYIYPELEEAPEDTEEAPEYEQMDYDQWVEAQENREAQQGETDPETVTAEDAREPEPEIMEAAEELEETEPEPILEEEQQPEQNTDPTDNLSEETRQAIDGYIEGTGNRFTDDQIEEIKEAMTTTDQPLYRVEDMSWMAENIDEGDTFTFDKPLKGFVNDFGAAATIIAEGEDAGLYEAGPLALYETVGPTKHLDISGMSRNHADESESLVGGTFRVVNQYDGPTIHGRETWIMQIEQIPEEKKDGHHGKR